IFGFPTHFTDVGNLNKRDRQRLLGKAWSVPVVVHLMKGLQKYFQTEICTDSENGSNAFNCPENQTNNMEQIFVDSENDFPNTIPHTTLLGSCIKSNVNWKNLPLRRQLIKLSIIETG
ncbi:unnamed protein product, partial [Meganyctiphanes norvegica]